MHTEKLALSTRQGHLNYESNDASNSNPNDYESE